MYSKESIYKSLNDIMSELFEIEADGIRPEARLYEDLDIDSIDAIDMIIKLKTLTGKKMQPADFKNVRTVQDVVDAVYILINTETTTHEHNDNQRPPYQ